MFLCVRRGTLTPFTPTSLFRLPLAAQAAILKNVCLLFSLENTPNLLLDIESSGGTQTFSKEAGQRVGAHASIYQWVFSNHDTVLVLVIEHSVFLNILMEL